MGRKDDNRLGLLGAVSYIVGNIIGTGIFIAPKGILEHTGSVGLSLILWTLCGAKAMLSAACFIELGTSIPESGAELAYINYMGWYPLGFSILWLTAVFQGSCSAAVIFLTFGEYIMQTVNSLVCLSDSTQEWAVKLFGYGLMFLMSVINLYSLPNLAGKIQIASMFSKILALGWIIGVGFYFLIVKGETEHFKPKYAFAGSKWNAYQLVLAFYQGGWAYSGYTTLNFGTEEVELKNFRKTFPLAVVGGLLLVIVVYLLTNVAYFTVLTPDEILNSNAVATLFIQRTLGQGASYAMPALVGLLLIGTVNSGVFISSRFLLAGARKGMLPTAMALVHPENDSPRMAILVHTLLCAGAAFVGNPDKLINYISIIGMTKTCITLTALIIIKLTKMPVAKGAIRLPIIFPITELLINICFIIIPFYQNLVRSAIGIGIFLIGCGSYYIFAYPKQKLKIFLAIDDAITKFCQILLWGVVDRGPEYQKEAKVPLVEEKESREIVKDPIFVVERF